MSDFQPFLIEFRHVVEQIVYYACVGNIEYCTIGREFLNCDRLGASLIGDARTVQNREDFPRLGGCLFKTSTLSLVGGFLDR